MRLASKVFETELKGYCRLPIADFLILIPNFYFPIPNSQFPIPNSQFLRLFLRDPEDLFNRGDPLQNFLGPVLAKGPHPVLYRGHLDLVGIDVL